MKSNIDDNFLIAERKRIGALIKEKRELKGLTHRQLANEMGINYATISKIEAGKWNFGIDTIASFGVALGFKIDIL